jgi:hemerythrin-like domain-containing protein
MANPPAPPTLLNDDGSASMATAFMMSHHGFRRDIARFGIALDRLTEGDHGRAAALQQEWQSFHATLHGHHEVEDNGIFPNLRQDPALTAVIDQLAADHRRIDPLLAEGDRAFGELPRSTAAAKKVVSEIAALLDTHLATEEAHVVPTIRGATAFPPPSTAAEVDLYAEGFAWSSHGVAPDILEKVYGMLPRVVTDKIPAARAAFAERCERVWGPIHEGASRTPIPDWLAR